MTTIAVTAIALKMGAVNMKPCSVINKLPKARRYSVFEFCFRLEMAAPMKPASAGCQSRAVWAKVPNRSDSGGGDTPAITQAVSSLFGGIGL